MPNNLIISYDPPKPGQSHDALHKAIEALGDCRQLLDCTWYVDSILSAEEAATALYKTLDEDDRLLVVDSSHNDATWYNQRNRVSDFLADHWND